MNTQPSVLDRIMGAVPVLGQIYGLGQAIFGKSQKENQDLQIAGQKEMTDYNYNKQIQMIGDSTYAQKQAYKDNNLNTALMYDGAGAGGSSAIQPGAMPSAPIAPNAVEKGQLAVQTATQLANLDLIKSQAEKNRADAEKTKGVDTDLTNQQINESNVRQRFLQLENDFAGKSFDQRLRMIELEADNMYYKQLEQNAKANVAWETQEDQKNIISNNAFKSGIEIIAGINHLKLQEAELNQITNTIAQKWKELNIQEAKTLYEHKDRLKILEDTLENQLWVAGIHAGGQLVGDLINMYTKFKNPIKIDKRKYESKTENYQDKNVWINDKKQ